MLSFLDVEIRRKNQTFTTVVYRKETNNYIYLDWNSLVPDTWKRRTLKTLMERAFVICSATKLRHVEMSHLKCVFTYKNNYSI